MAEDKEKGNDDYVEFFEIDGDDSNSTIIVEKRCKKHIKSYYDPKTAVPLPCPYKPPRREDHLLCQPASVPSGGF